ncbi:MAG: dienelactone hydrolase family protein [Halioglobus sp.]|nr:dienelactone hydrolase family protein [Halioglobus sp.]
MTSTATKLEYLAGDTLCKGEYYTPDNADGLRPVVLVCHAWDGLNDEVRDKAMKLAEAGYIAFAIDVHGDGKVITDFAELMPTLTPYLEDRALLLARMRGALDAARTIPGADVSRIGAMGYCFGGMAVLDLARAGESIKGVVSFHGSLDGNALDGPKTLATKILVLHGDDDPLVPPETVAAFKAEMNAKQVDWQLHAYSQTVHAFTRPAANDPAFGAVYNAAADRRSWQSMLNFFEEVL